MTARGGGNRPPPSHNFACFVVRCILHAYVSIRPFKFLHVSVRRYAPNTVFWSHRADVQVTSFKFVVHHGPWLVHQPPYFRHMARFTQASQTCLFLCLFLSPFLRISRLYVSLSISRERARARSLLSLCTILHMRPTSLLSASPTSLHPPRLDQATIITPRRLLVLPKP